MDSVNKVNCCVQRNIFSVFPLLPSDIRDYIIFKMTVLDRYFFNISSKFFCQLIPQHEKVPRTTLLKLAITECSLTRIIHLLPNGPHWIVKRCLKDPTHFWALLGYSNDNDPYTESFYKIRTLYHILTSVKWNTAGLALMVRVGVKRHYVSCYLTQIIMDHLSRFPVRRRISNLNLSMLMNSLVRSGCANCLAYLLQQYHTIPAEILNSCMRLACTINMVPEFAKILLPFYEF
jgi:hypothetical protein